MNNPNPISPLTPLAQGGRGNRNVRIAVISIVALHGVFFAGLLFQGCDRRPDASAKKDTDTPFLATTNAYGSATALTNPAYADITNWPSYAAQYGGTVSNTTTPGVSGAAQPAAGLGTTGIVGGVDTNGGSGLGGTGGLVTGIESVTDIVDPGAAAITTYKIKKGDTLAKIANAHGITMKALNDANPGLDAKKLQIGKELKLPAAKKTTVADAGTAAGGAAVEGTTYTVAKGDTLTGIARKFGVTVPEIRKANGLKTDSIAVGKKLKIPTSAKPATTAATTPTP
jgi:LysM repeat protein